MNTFLSSKKLLKHLLLGLGAAAATSLSAETIVLFSFEDETEQGFYNHGDQPAAIGLIPVPGFGNTDGDHALAMTSTHYGWAWAIRVDMLPESAAYQAIVANYGEGSEYSLRFDVTYHPDFMGGLNQWHQLFVAMQSGNNWNQIDQVIDNSFEGGITEPVTYTANIPLAPVAGGFVFDPTAESLNIIISTNGPGGTVDQFFLFFDNFRVTNEAGGGGTDPEPVLYLGTWAVVDGWADTGAWLGWLYVENAPWVYSYSNGGFLYVAEDSFDASSGAWLYAPAPAAPAM